MVRVSVRGVISVTAVALVPWMLFWGVRLVTDSDELVRYHYQLSNEFRPAKYDPSFSPQDNEEVAKRWREMVAWDVQDARGNIKSAYVRQKQAEVMLTKVSLWAIVIAALVALGLFGSRYRVRLDRKEVQAPAPSGI